MREEVYIEAKMDLNQVYNELNKLENTIKSKDVNLKIKATVDREGLNYTREITAAVNDATSAQRIQSKAILEQAQSNKVYKESLTTITNVMGTWSEEQKNAIGTLVALQNQMGNLKKKIKESSGAIKDQAQVELRALQERFRTVSSEVRNMENEMRRGITGAQSVRDKFSKSLQIGFFSTFGAFSLAGMVKKGIDATVKFLKDGISEAISFESAFAGVRKTIEATEFEFQTFNRELKLMATEIPRTYQELAKIAELGGQMGVPLEELSAFTKAIAALEVSTDIGLEDAALQFSRLATIMNISMEDIGRIGSAVVDLGNNFAATESEITNFMMRIAGTGNVVNMTAGDIAGISTAFTAVGIAAEKGGTAVNKMLLGIETAVVQGGKELETYAKLAGRTAEDFVRGWRENAGGIFADVVEGLGEAGSDANDYLVELLGNGTRIKEVFLNMAGASDVLTDAVQKGNTAYAQNNALWEEAAKRYGTTESQLQILDNKMAQNKERLGKELLPVYVRWKELLVDVVGWIAKAASAVEALGEAVRRSKDGLISMLEIGIDASKRTNMIEFIPDGFVSRVEDARAKLDGFDTSLTGVEAALKKVNLAMDETDERVAELTASYSNGKISLDEYTEGLVEQFKAKAQLEEQQKVAIERLTSEQFFLDKIKDSQKALTKAQDDFAKKEVDLSKNRAELKLVEERLEAIDKKYSELDKQRPEIKLKIDDLNQQKTDIEDKINGINKAMNKGEEATQKYTKALEGYSTLNELAKWSDGARQAIEDLNNNPLNTKEDRDEAAKSVVALQRYTEEMIRAYKAKNLFLLSQFSAANEIAKSGTKLEKAALFVAEKLGNGRVGLKKEVLQNDKLVKDLQALAKEDIGSLFDKTPSGGGAGDLREEYNLQAMTISELNDEMSRLNEIINTSVVGSERYNTALQDRTTLQERLNDIIRDQQKLTEKELSGAKTVEDAKKAQIKLIELEAMRRIGSLKLIAENEEQLAEGIVGIAEWASKEKKKLEEDYLSLAVDGAKEIIKKYEEMRKVGVQAFKDITKEIESNAKEIDKLTDNIDKIKKKLSELDDTKVKDLGARYVEVKEQIEAITKKIEEAELQTEEFSDSSLTVKEGWDELQKSIKEVTKSTEDYAKQIEKIREKMEDLGKTEVDKLSERYAKVVEEIKTISKDLEPLQKYDILTDSDAQKKLELEDKLNKLLSEQLKIRGALSPEQLLRADEMVGETETDKIIREAKEKRDTYQQELKDFELKLQKENTILEDYKKQEEELLKKYSWLEVDTDKAKYQELIKNIKEYTTERDKLLKEQSHLEMLLSAKDIQDAINQSKKTETQLILDKYNLELATMNAELDEYKKLQKNKIEALTQFYLDALELQKKYKALGLDFTPEQKQQLATAAQQVASIPKEQQYISQDYLITQNKLLKEQEEAKDKLDIIAKSLAKISDAQLKGMGDQALREMFAKIAELKIVASGANIGSSSSTTNSIVNNQSFNLASNLDAQAIARQIRLAIKL